MPLDDSIWQQIEPSKYVSIAELNPNPNTINQIGRQNNSYLKVDVKVELFKVKGELLGWIHSKTQIFNHLRSLKLI